MELKNNNSLEEERYYEAKKQVEALKGFYGNLIAYIAFNIFFLIINLKTSPEHLWFFWPLLGWGIGVFFHAMKVFNFSPFFGRNWEKRKIKEFLEKEQKQKNMWH
ncbi:2TM domain-containing protein [Flavobacterium aciduliphilum]|uniref:2TM domain-containing protein n=1 Tax=Flavobacterium aciduliphilum TaxID=1101402 RepID=A0A328YAA5_9FLAO|nr:2TM domain-containing protein [Flavobacterium aciduliphilum]RAR70104.1 2TM domain-containing protein [Flavobacterium aciduliphilum]